jgi:hypothetical protein
MRIAVDRVSAQEPAYSRAALLISVGENMCCRLMTAYCRVVMA